MEIKYQRHTLRRQRAMNTWLEVIKLYNNGMTAIDIAKKFKKTRIWVYKVLKQFNTK